MRKSSINARTNPKLKKSFSKLAESMELSVSDLLNMFMRAAVDGKIHVAFLNGGNEEFHYPDWYAKELNRQSKETMRLYRKGKVKGYTDPDEMMHDMLKECA